MPDGKDYYSVLGVAPDSEDIVIRAAYRVLMQKYHPDKWADGTSFAEIKAREINEAYAVLSDPDARSNYDSIRNVRPAIASQSAQPPGNDGRPAAPEAVARAQDRQSNSVPLRAMVGFVGMVGVIAMIAALASRDHYRQSDAAIDQPPALATPAATNTLPAVKVAMVLRPASPRPLRKIAQSDTATRSLAGMLGAWKLAGASDCSALYRLAADGTSSLALTGPDGTRQRETILGMDGDWVHAAAGDASSFYRIEDGLLVYRDASVSNSRSETRFARCD